MAFVAVALMTFPGARKMGSVKKYHGVPSAAHWRPVMGLSPGGYQLVGQPADGVHPVNAYVEFRT